MRLVSIFLNELKGLGPYWGIWLKVLGLLNFIVPIFLIYHPMAQITLLIFLLQAVFMLFLFSVYGFVPLLGLAHFGWFILLYILFQNVALVGEQNLIFRCWFFTLIIANSISLVIDVYDVGRFFLK